MPGLKRLSEERGFTLVEFGIVGLISMVLLTLISVMLIASFRTSHYTQGQSFTLDDARTSLQQIQRDIQNASFIDFCDNEGGCLEVVTFSPTEETRFVRYEVQGADLFRADFDSDANAFGAQILIIDKLENPNDSPVFTCDLETSLLRVNVDLYVQPRPDYAATYHLKTSVRPRNYPASANCP